jgi:hypothetical protein
MFCLPEVDALAIVSHTIPQFPEFFRSLIDYHNFSHKSYQLQEGKTVSLLFTVIYSHYSPSMEPGKFDTHEPVGWLG